ncbi:BAR adaptor protein Hob3 [Saxophila tyrrhenica]|uniref:BAR adaptor protein Hob3 n=1 Tax=Saxophila tyrrhenica TaxID=1690608 RepID=A0AAV9P4V4_9PEZI|nr:BAR adaptor protein Hob3 [Saxophila tyrrhenica]
MSWSGFKKNVGRATTQVMMKTGHVEKTSDREYEVEERRYRTLEAASLRLQKEAKGYLDSLRAMTASQMRIAETIDAFYGDSGAKDGVSRSYKQAVEDLDAETVKALDGPYRCVPDSLLKYAADDEVVRDIEGEWNFKAGNRRVYTRGGGDVTDGSPEHGLMEYLYRTTVLDPINRFCAYFPDINECIKKRQHKMLDYDSVRSRVKKLTEKPDKDPGKLPRTEKEAEMVSHETLLAYPQHTTNAHHTTGKDGCDYELDLSIPSPPKALQRPEIQKLRGSDCSAAADVRSGPRKLSRVTTWSSGRQSGGPESMQRCPSMALRKRPAASSVSSSFDSTIQEGTPTADRGEPAQPHTAPAFRTASTPLVSQPQTFIPFPQGALAKARRDQTITNRPSTMPAPPSRPSLSTPFFNPSELEEIMQPFRLEFIKKEADELEQAKAQYEQLNEQLTSELPQLIDLRVPYLDPTFEALVKIQLRFCAEAYSRMAQVQQYLDASTRDQYASGDLDARVEDVLGQIRELSIAGTV